MNIKLTFVAAALGAVAISSATPYDVKFKGTDLGKSVSITFFGSTKNVFAGKLRFQAMPAGAQFLTVCADLAHSIYGGQIYKVENKFSAASPLGVQKAGNIVADKFAGANTADKAAALQVAVWEALYDGGSAPSFTSGNFCLNGASSSFKSLAASYYSAISKSGNALYLKTTTNTGQSQLTVVPEPAALAALAIGAGLLIRRKKA